MNLIYLFSISLLTELTSILFETPPTNYDYTVPQEWIVNIEEITGNLT